MSSIGSLSSYGSSNAYATARTQRNERPNPAEMQQKLFAKIDSDGGGSIDATELQSALDALAGGSGQASTVTAQDMLKGLDADSDGSISDSEFAKALQGSSPPPPPGGAGGPPPMSTADFARSRSDSTQAGETDPLMALDSDQDGAVSATEFGITDDTDSSIKDFFKAIDSDGDGSITSTEAASFKDKLAAHFESARGGGASAASTQALGQRDLEMLASLVNSQYGAVAGAANETASNRLLAAV